MGTGQDRTGQTPTPREKPALWLAFVISFCLLVLSQHTQLQAIYSKDLKHAGDLLERCDCVAVQQAQRQRFGVMGTTVESGIVVFVNEPSMIQASTWRALGWTMTRRPIAGLKLRGC